MTFDGVKKFQHQAMGTEWRLFLPEDSPSDLAAAARAVFALVDRLESDLSRFDSGSFISRLSRLSAGDILRVNEATFHCLALAKALHAQTRGAFDITVQAGNSGWESSMDAFILEPESMQVQTLADGLRLDLGGVGKGFAVDEAVQWLESNGFVDAFVDAGESTMYAMGSLPGAVGKGWPVSVGHDQVCSLRDRALAASGFEIRGQHIIDPRSGFPLITERRRSWVFAGSAAVADGLSTAAMIMSDAEIVSFSRDHPDVSFMIL